MAVWSEVNKSELRGAMRLDAEYYQPRYLQYAEAVAHGERMGDLLKSLMHPVEIVRVYEETGIQILLAQNIRHNQLDFSVRVFMPHSVESVLARNLLQHGDVVVTRSGANYGDCAPYLGEPKRIYACADCLILRPSSEIDGRYLSTFLNSEVGRGLMKRGQYGAGQPHIAPTHIKGIRVPRLGSVEDQICDHVSKAQEKRQASVALYTQAEDLLLSELGLDELDQSTTLFCERDFSEAQQAARLDAEFFSPRVQRIIATLSEGGLTISDVATLEKRHFKPKSGVPFQYIEIADVGTSGTSDSKEVPGEDAPSRATWIVKSGDVLTTTVRPIRRLSAIVTKSQDNFVCSSGFAVLKSRNIEPQLLLVYLRLPIVAELIDLYTTASMYPAISTADLLSIPFKMPRERIRRKLVEMVKASFVARDESRRLLDKAKRMVEEAVLSEGG